MTEPKDGETKWVDGKLLIYVDGTWIEHGPEEEAADDAEPMDDGADEV